MLSSRMGQYYDTVIKQPSCLFLLLLCCHLFPHPGRAHFYNDSQNLLKDLFQEGRYDQGLRPKVNQSEATTIFMVFQTMSIIALDDVSQKLTVSLIASISWLDEHLRWDVYEYGGLSSLKIDADRIWRPKFVVTNTLTKLDPFDANDSILVIHWDGYVVWHTWSLSETSCLLDVENYPFDEQTCTITMCPFGYSTDSLVLLPSLTAIEPVSAEWQVEYFGVNLTFDKDDRDMTYPCMLLTYTLQRKAGLSVLNIVLPVILLAVINNFVFIIPVESGEKISFVVTVLLALALFMTLIGSLLPRSTVPKVTIYLCCLLGMSALSVLLTIGFVALYHAGENSSDDKGSDSNIESDDRGLPKVQSGQSERSRDNSKINFTGQCVSRFNRREYGKRTCSISGHSECDEFYNTPSSHFGPFNSAVKMTTLHDNFNAPMRNTMSTTKTNRNTHTFSLRKTARILDIICFVIFNSFVAGTTIWFFLHVSR